LNRRLDTLRRKEATEKEVAEEDEEEEEDRQVLALGSGDDDDPVSPIRFSRVMSLLKCPICLNYLYEHKNGYSSTSKASSRMKCHPDLVQQHLHLSRLLDMQPLVICEDHELVVWWMKN
jgi:hypothetical protein